jgi:hypothetical protein
MRGQIKLFFLVFQFLKPFSAAGADSPQLMNLTIMNNHLGAIIFAIFITASIERSVSQIANRPGRHFLHLSALVNDKKNNEKENQNRDDEPAQTVELGFKFFFWIPFFVHLAPPKN